MKHVYSLSQIAQMRDKVKKNVTAKVVVHSIAHHEAPELVTMEVNFPRMVLAEFNTHCVFSRNSASSRAIPVEVQLRMILDNLYLPFFFGANKSGMQANEELEGDDLIAAVNNFMVGRDIAILQAVALMGGVKTIKGEALQEELGNMMENYTWLQGFFMPQAIGLHKQNANRVLEPYMWHKVIVTATDWANFYGLRCNEHAQPEIREAALAMIKAHEGSSPTFLKEGEWHTPYINEDEQSLPAFERKSVSAGRCARVSYLTHDGVRDISKDMELYQRLLDGGHMSPLEHVATYDPKARGKLRSWRAYRQDVKDENDFSKKQAWKTLLTGLKGDENLLDFLLTLE